jgi:hypothetical protein
VTAVTGQAVTATAPGADATVTAFPDGRRIDASLRAGRRTDRADA